MIPALVSGRHSRRVCNPPTPITRVCGRILICAISDLLSQDSWTLDLMNTVFLLLLTSRDTEQDELLPVFPSQTTILRIQVIEGKKGHIHFLEEILPPSIEYIRQQLLYGKRVCIACNTGRDISVGVALCALQQFFDDEGNYVATKLDSNRKRSLPHLRAYVLITTHVANKKSIRTRLEWIISSRPLANPSRTTLKRVNEFFLSPSKS